MSLTKVTYSMIDGAPINVSDYGAVGDGVIDDTAAVQAALDVGGKVHFPNGTYLISDTLDVSSDTFLSGNGQTSKLQVKSDSLLPLFSCAANDNISFSNLYLSGNSTTQQSASSSSSAIESTNGSSNITVENCIIENWTRHGIVLDGVTNAVISNNRINQTWYGSGVLISRTAVSTDCKVIGNYISNTQQGNIQSYFGVDGWLIQNNICDTTDAGITVAGGGEAADNITGYVEDATGSNTNVICTGNVCKNSGNHGIHLGGDNIVINSNNIINPATAGIFAAKGDNITPDLALQVAIVGNTIQYTGAVASDNRGIIARNYSNVSITSNSISGAYIGIELNGIDTAGTGLNSGAVTGNSIFEYELYGIWFRNNVTKFNITGNQLNTTAASTDFRLDLVTATAKDNFIFNNMTFLGSGLYFGQLLQATAFNVVSVGNVNGEHLRVGSSTTSIVNYLSVAGNAAGSAPLIASAGSDTNIDLTFAPKGSGVVRFGTHSGIGGETVTGYITIKDSAGNSRKLAVVS